MVMDTVIVAEVVYTAMVTVVSYENRFFEDPKDSGTASTLTRFTARLRSSCQKTAVSLE